MQTLTSERLLLRPWEDDDVDVVFDMYSRWEVQRFIGVVPRVMTERREAEERVARLKAFDDPVLGIWAVALQGSAVVGTLLLKSIPPPRPPHRCRPRWGSPWPSSTFSVTGSPCEPISGAPAC